MSIDDALEAAAGWMRLWGYGSPKLTGVGRGGAVHLLADGGIASVAGGRLAIEHSDIQRLVQARGADYEVHLLHFSEGPYSAHALQYADEVGVALFRYPVSGAPIAINARARQVVDHNPSDVVRTPAQEAAVGRQDTATWKIRFLRVDRLTYDGLLVDANSGEARETDGLVFVGYDEVEEPQDFADRELDDSEMIRIARQVGHPLYVSSVMFRETPHFTAQPAAASIPVQYLQEGDFALINKVTGLVFDPAEFVAVALKGGACSALSREASAQSRLSAESLGRLNPLESGAQLCIQRTDHFPL